MPFCGQSACTFIVTLDNCPSLLLLPRARRISYPVSGNSQPIYIRMQRIEVTKNKSKCQIYAETTGDTSMISVLTSLLQRSTRQRHFSTSLLTAKHSIYVSQSSDPYFNLTFEDWYAISLSVEHRIELRHRLFKEKPSHEPLLLIYRDRPCVVIGRNQNPWKEVNFHELHRANIPFIRRRSGGGTVYHVCVLASSNTLWAHFLRVGHGKHQFLYPPSAQLVRSKCYRQACPTRCALMQHRRVGKRTQRHLRWALQDEFFYGH